MLVNIGSGYALAPHRCQAITWSDVDPDLQYYLESPGAQWVKFITTSVDDT